MHMGAVSAILGLLGMMTLFDIRMVQSGCSKSYIVVGSGASGAPMAYKLAKAGCKVTVIEKGPDDNWHGEVEPGLTLDLFNPEYSYLIQMKYAAPSIQSVVWSQPVWDKTAAGSFGRDWSTNLHFSTCPGHCEYSEFAHLANVVGGNTVHNLGFWQRGAMSQYESWGQGWNEASVMLSKMKEVEAMYAVLGPDKDLLESKKSGMASSLDDTVMELLKRGGFTQMRSRDLGEAADKAIAWTEWVISRAGRRLSAGTVFIDPVRDVPGFTLITNAEVSHVLFLNGTNKAVGVLYTDRISNIETKVEADEVILAAGALVTPHILMNSGIGPAADLKALGIPVVADLPVGMDYQNRVKVNIVYCFNGSIDRSASAGIEFAAYPSMNKTHASSFMSTQPNMWGMIKTPFATEGLADLAIWVDTNTAFGPLVQTGHARGHGHVVTCPSEKDFPVTFMLSAMLPKSKGRVSIKSAAINMRDGLLQSPGYLSHADDAKTISYGVDLLRKTLSTDSRFYELVPTAASQEDHIYSHAHTFWHDSSTAPMGKVVDEKLKVMGLEGLRVTDTSVHPRICNMAPSAMAHVTGYYGADIVLTDAHTHSDVHGSEL